MKIKSDKVSKLRLCKTKILKIRFTIEAEVEEYGKMKKDSLLQIDVDPLKEELRIFREKTLPLGNFSVDYDCMLEKRLFLIRNEKIIFFLNSNRMVLF